MQWGGAGRVRIEAVSSTFTGTCSPGASYVPVGASVSLFPDNSVPFAQIISVGGSAVPDDPTGNMGVGQQDTTVQAGQPAKVRIRTYALPTTWTVRVRLVPNTGDAVNADAVLIGPDTDGSLLWEATVTFPAGPNDIQVRAFAG